MIGQDYRLDNVVARLIERLEASRRSYSRDPEAAEAAFARIADEHLDAAIGEFREVTLFDEPEAHAAFLRQEVHQTFLPRYAEAATAMNAREKAGFGFGPIAGPVGRIAVGIAALFGILVAERLGLGRALWVVVPLLLSMPILPDIGAWFVRRRYRKDLEAMVVDMDRIQAQATAYTSADRLKLASADTATPGRRPPPQKEML